MGAPLHIAYRPATLDEVAGNKGTIDAIRSILSRDIEHIPHAWLFSGPSGMGKTTLARIIKTELGCSDMDYKEFNSGSMRGIDTIREVEQNSRLSPMNGKVKVYLFDEVHNWTKAAKEASLKMLEDAPKNVFFFLATTEPGGLPKAMRTRLTDVVVKSLNTKEIMRLLKDICAAEEANIQPEILQAIALASDGSCREAVKMLDSVFDVTDTDAALETISNTHVGEATVIELCRALIKGESWKQVSKILSLITDEPESVRRACGTYFTKVLLGDGSQRTAEILEQFERNWYDGGRASMVLACFAANQASRE